jgi:regulatory protein
MQIKKIIKKGSKSALLLLDDDSELVIHYEVFMKSGLRKGDNLSDDRILFFLNEHKKQIAKETAFRILSRRMHSVKEIEIKLRQKKVEPEIINTVISDLLSLQLLDDNRFAEMFTAEMIQYKRFGAYKIKIELYKRGIREEIIEDVITKQIPENPFDNALHLAKKKLNTLKNRNYEQNSLKQKIGSFLYSKGYDFDTIKKVVSELLTSISEDNEEDNLE